MLDLDQFDLQTDFIPKLIKEEKVHLQIML